VATKRIGLLPSYEAGMPLGFESFFKFLDLKIKHKGETYDFEVDRMRIRPLDMRHNLKQEFDLLIDRTTHWQKFTRAYVQQAILDGVYVLNHPDTFNVVTKHASFAMLQRLGADVPDTLLMPQALYLEDFDYYRKQLEIKPKQTQEKYDEGIKLYVHYRDHMLPMFHQHHTELFDFEGIPARLGGYPIYLKPGIDGGGGRAVSRIKNLSDLHEKYEESEECVMTAQQNIEYEKFVRCMGIGPQVLPMRFLPDEPIHRHYDEVPIDLTKEEREQAIKGIKVVNALWRWEYNSFEALFAKGRMHPIDFANACPDSAITSLHVWWPWVIKALVRWTTYCTVTDRKMRMDLDQQDYLTAGGKDAKPAERFEACAERARTYFEEDRFREFAAKHLSHLDEAFAEWHDKGGFEPVLQEEIRISRFPDYEKPQMFDEYRAKVARSVREGMGLEY